MGRKLVCKESLQTITMATLTKKDLLEIIKSFLCYIKRPFCKHNHLLCFKSIKKDTTITNYYKCSNCGKEFKIYLDTRYDY